MSNLNRLITSSLENSDPSFLFSFPEELLTEAEISWKTWIRKYSINYGKTPTMERFKLEFPLFVQYDDSSPIEDIYDRTILAYRNLYTRNFIMTHADELREGADPSELILSLSNTLQKGGGELLSIRDVDRSAYLEAEDSKPWGVDAIQKACGGFFDGDLAYIFGRPGSGKTTFVESRAAYWWEIEERVLFISNESSATEVLAAIDSQIAGYNPLMRRTGEWTKRSSSRLQALTYLTSEGKGDIVVPRRRVTYPEDLFAIAHTYRPTIIIVDGVYLMKHRDVRGGGWEAAAAVSRDLKQIAKELKLPIFGVIQANKEAEGKRASRGAVAHTDAYLQDADFLFAVSPADETNQTVIELLKNRWGPLSGFVLNIDHNDMLITESKAYVAEDEVAW